MSERSLNRDPGPHRVEAYIELSNNELQEALWEAIKAIKASGIDVGVKADLILDQREGIKAKYPK